MVEEEEGGGEGGGGGRSGGGGLGVTMFSVTMRYLSQGIPRYST